MHLLNRFLLEQNSNSPTTTQSPNLPRSPTTCYRIPQPPQHTERERHHDHNTDKPAR